MISSRLDAIVDIVPVCRVAADIGCDHGKVAISLLKKEKADFIICTDISAPSLEKARKLAVLEDLEDSVSCRQGDGLNVLKENEADVAVIAGMGGELMTGILKDGNGSVPEILVLSCNSAAGVLRKWLSENRYVIEDEELVFEGRHYYPVILAKSGQSKKLSELELEIGPVILRKKTKVLEQFLKQKINTAREIRKNLLNANVSSKKELIEKIDEQLKRYGEIKI